MWRTIIMCIVLFAIGFVSDLTMQLIKNSFPRVALFDPYWQYYTPFPAAIIAGIITLVFGGLFLLMSIAIYKGLKLETKSLSFFLFSVSLAVVLGVILDVLTNYNNWLGYPLRKWYDTMGATDASLWSGALTFLFVSILATTVYIQI